MFAERLTKEQRQHLYGLMYFIAQADKEITEEEQKFLDLYGHTFGLECIECASQINLDESVAAMDTYQAKIITLQELIRLSYADGHFGEEERERVVAIARRLGVSDSVMVKHLERWVRKGLEWLFEGEEMIMGHQPSWTYDKSILK
jgi:uncharacterized tellurite resistance protein B-like protein